MAKRRKQKAEKAPNRPEMEISEAAMMAARGGANVAMLPEQIFARPGPMPGVVPSSIRNDKGAAIKLATDSYGVPANLPSISPLASWGLQSLFHEGLGFLGFPYLAELSQRDEYRRISEIWAEHATRKWIKIRGPEEKVKALERFLGDGDGGIGLKAAMREAIEHDGLSGRCHLFLDFDDFDDEDEIVTPLVADDRKVNNQRPLKRLKVVQPYWTYPGMYNSTNPLAPDFYKPSSWYVMGKTIHESRMLTIVGAPLPDILRPSYAFAGLSRTQRAKAYVDNWLRGRQNASEMANTYSQMVLETEMGTALQGGSGVPLFKRVDLFNQTRSNRGTMVVQKGEESLTNVAVPLTGIPELLAQAFEQVAAAARIPLSIYLKITPKGLNASSEGEIREFYADVKGYQEGTIRAPVHTIIDFAQLSLFGAIDEEITFEFPDLWEMSAKELAEIRASDGTADTGYVNAGIVSPDEVRERLSNDETGLYHGVDLDGPAPEPEPETAPVVKPPAKKEPK